MALSGAFSGLFAPAAEMQRVSSLFLRVLALIYFSAFASLAFQIAGLAGPEGILPFADRLPVYRAELGNLAYLKYPTVFWISASDTALVGVTVAGCLLSVLLLFNIRPRAVLIGLFVLYLSLFHAGQMFMNFQWDYLLLEAGFLAIFIPGGPSRLVVWLFHWLLFRLRFLSGASKLITGDTSWSEFTALEYYFETQPLPHTGAWFAHQLPDGILMAGVVFVLFAELLIPWLMFLPRRWRLFAAWTTLLTQALIIATSNHNFFNVLTMALCLFLLDDRALPRWWWLTGPRAKRTEGTPIPVAGAVVRLASLVSALVIVPVSLGLMWEMLSGRPVPEALAKVTPYVRSFGVAHRYHVFPTMKTDRIEIEVEGSHDGNHWLPYKFKYKPQAVAQRPAFIIPHQPRLDWMMWFIPLGMAMNQIWFEAFMERLLDNAPKVTTLLAENPFADTPPRYIQASAYLYRFTTPEERAQSGDWWVRESLGPLFPFPRQR